MTERSPEAARRGETIARGGQTEAVAEGPLNLLHSFKHGFTEANARLARAQEEVAAKAAQAESIQQNVLEIMRENGELRAMREARDRAMLEVERGREGMEAWVARHQELAEEVEEVLEEVRERWKEREEEGREVSRVVGDLEEEITTIQRQQEEGRKRREEEEAAVREEKAATEEARERTAPAEEQKARLEKETAALLVEKEELVKAIERETEECQSVASKAQELERDAEKVKSSREEEMARAARAAAEAAKLEEATTQEAEEVAKKIMQKETELSAEKERKEGMITRMTAEEETGAALARASVDLEKKVQWTDGEVETAAAAREQVQRQVEEASMGLESVRKEREALQQAHARALHRLFVVDRELGKAKRAVEEWEGTKEGIEARALVEKKRVAEGKLVARFEEWIARLEGDMARKRERAQKREEVKARAVRCQVLEDGVREMEVKKKELEEGEEEKRKLQEETGRLAEQREALVRELEREEERLKDAAARAAAMEAWGLPPVHPSSGRGRSTRASSRQPQRGEEEARKTGGGEELDEADIEPTEAEMAWLVQEEETRKARVIADVEERHREEMRVREVALAEAERQAESRGECEARWKEKLSRAKERVGKIQEELKARQIGGQGGGCMTTVAQRSERAERKESLKVAGVARAVSGRHVGERGTHEREKKGRGRGRAEEKEEEVEDMMTYPLEESLEYGCVVEEGGEAKEGEGEGAGEEGGDHAKNKARGESFQATNTTPRRPLAEQRKFSSGPVQRQNRGREGVGGGEERGRQTPLHRLPLYSPPEHSLSARAKPRGRRQKQGQQNLGQHPRFSSPPCPSDSHRATAYPNPSLASSPLSSIPLRVHGQHRQKDQATEHRDEGVGKGTGGAKEEDRRETPTQDGTRRVNHVPREDEESGPERDASPGEEEGAVWGLGKGGAEGKEEKGLPSSQASVQTLEELRKAKRLQQQQRQQHARKQILYPSKPRYDQRGRFGQDSPGCKQERAHRNLYSYKKSAKQRKGPSWSKQNMEKGSQGGRGLGGGTGGGRLRVGGSVPVPGRYRMSSKIIIKELHETRSIGESGRKGGSGGRGGGGGGVGGGGGARRPLAAAGDEWFSDDTYNF